jgi:hypothetical protein
VRHDEANRHRFAAFIFELITEEHYFAIYILFTFSENRISGTEQIFVQACAGTPIIVAITVRIQNNNKVFVMIHLCGTPFVTLVEQYV